MTDNSPNLDLHYLLASQSQKHVTFNELINKIDALLMLAVSSKSITTPPSAPMEGQSYIIPENATGEWQNKSGKIAYFQNLGWTYMTPKNGFVTMVSDEVQFYFYNNGWIKLSTTQETNTFSKIGIGINSDANFPFSTKLNNALFSAKYSSEGGYGNIRIQLNKEISTKTASFIFQDNWSGQAEFGLIGDDSFAIKTSSDGANWINPFKINSAGRIKILGLDAPAIAIGNNEIIRLGTNRFINIPKAPNTDGQNLFIGISAGPASTNYVSSSIDASYNVGIGYAALNGLGSGCFNLAVGASALQSNNTGRDNVAIGFAAMAQNTNGSGNLAIGSTTLYGLTTGSYNVAIGLGALYINNGSYNVSIGQGSLSASASGNNNTALGFESLKLKTDGTANDSFNNCTGIGSGARVSASNQVQLGSSNTTTYAYGAVQDRSDMRDKADIRDTVLGLDFICSLRPVDFKWDMRDDYFKQ